MTRKFLRPPKKYMSRANAARSLKLSVDDFTTLSILLDVKPVRPKQWQCLDHMDTVYYRIEEVQRMINTQLFLDINRQNRLRRKREEYASLGRYKKDVAVDYFALVMSKYSTFDSAVRGLPFSLKILYIKRWLGTLSKNAALGSEDFEDRTPCSRSGEAEREEALERFHEVVRCHFPLQRCFIGKDGFHLGTGVSACRVEWFVPFRLEERRESKVLDTLYPLCRAHVVLASMHLEKFARSSGVDTDNATRRRVLDGIVFRVDSALYRDIYELVIVSAGGRVSESDYKYVLCDGEICTLEAGAVYVQPQFVFDALNDRELPSVQEYLAGRAPPLHRSPFREEKIAADEDELFTMSRQDGKAYAGANKLRALE